jgi:hypothetical protein
MRRVNYTNTGNIKDPVAKAAIEALIRASAEVDITDIFAPYTITGSFTETRDLNVTTPTLANIAAVLATIITDCKRGGQHRTT